MHSARTKTMKRNTMSKVLLVAVCAAFAAPLTAANPDAIIQDWVENWTLNADGSTEYYFKQHVLLGSDRTYHEFADPRITYDVNTDKIEIINARVQRADGTYRDLVDYSHVQVSPQASAGWPAFTSIQQHLLVMGGIEPGCVVELEYKITSRPGAKRQLAADVRLDHQYPVRRREIRVETPTNVEWTSAFGGVTPRQVEQAMKYTGKGETKLNEMVLSGFGLRGWVFEKLPGVPDEPQAGPWQARCARFSFATADSAERWVKDTLGRIDAAANESPLITKLAVEWTEDEFQATDMLRVIQEKLSGSFNFVTFDTSWQPAGLRPAAETLRSNHGLAEETAAVLLSLARAAGIPARLGLLVNDDIWTDEAPQRSLVAAYVVLLDHDGVTEIWDAQRGRIVRDDHWAGHTVLALTDGKLQRTALPAWTDADESRCGIVGNITIDEDGKFAGELSLRTTGLFVSPERLRASGGQKSRVKALVRRVLPDANVKSFDVTALGGGEFAAEVKIESSDALPKIGGAYRLQFAENGPFQANVPMPLAYSERVNPVHLTGPFDEDIKLTITWPAGWTLEAMPRERAASSGDWGQVQQRIRPAEDGLTVMRHTRVTRAPMPAKDFLDLRGPLNELRTEAARTLILQP